MKRITKILVVLAMILSLSNMSMLDVSANDTYKTVTSTLDFRDKTGDDNDVDGSEYGYYWDSSELTLTVYGLTLITESYYAICLPNGTTILLDGDLSAISAQETLYCEGVFSIEGIGDVYLEAEISSGFSYNAIDQVKGSVDMNYDGSLTINAPYGFSDYYYTDLNLVLTGDLIITSYSHGILVRGNANLDVKGILSIEATYFKGITSDKSLTITVGGDCSISGLRYGITADDATITVGGDCSISATKAAISVDNSLDMVVAGESVINGSTIIINDDTFITYRIYIDSLEIEGWTYTEYSEQENTPIVNASIEDDFDSKYTGDVTYTYYEDADCIKEVDDITTALAGTYYVKASIASTTYDNYVTIGTYAIEEFVIDTKYYSVTIDGVEDEVAYGEVIETPTKEGYTFDGWEDADGEVYTDEITVTSDLVLYTMWTEITVDSDDTGDTDVDGDTDTDVDEDTNADDVVDTGDTNNVLAFTILSAGALALILTEMKKRIRV